MKDDERRFLIEVYNRCTTHYGGGHNTNVWVTPRVLINETKFPIHHKRAWYLLEKWSDKGYYECGVTMDLGWLTDEGLSKARSLLGEVKTE